MRFAAVLLALVSVTACSDDGPSAGPPLARDSDWSAPIGDRSRRFDVTPWSAESFEATDLAFLPDGSALLITKGGWQGRGTGSVVLLGADGSTQDVVLELAVCTDAERGLLGIEIDPDFESSGLVYLFYTRDMNGCATTAIDELDAVEQPVYNRVSSFRFRNGVIDAESERVLLDELPGHQSSHNGGGLQFMPDGTLLVSVGEGRFERARDLDFPAGKLLRLDLSAGVRGAADNPFFDASQPESVRSMVYASGLRNPFRFDVDPASGRVAVADVGTDDFEEIDLIEPGGDYGFPDGEGPAPVDRAIGPALWYSHESGCASVIGGAWVPPGWVPDTVEPGFAFADFGCTALFVASFDGDRASTVTTITSPLGYSVSSVMMGPDEALYAVGIGPGPRPVVRVAPADGDRQST